MSYKDVFDVFKRERKLSDDETALLNSLRRMTPAEMESLAETLGPPVKAKVSKVKTTRNMAHCGACDFTRRAAWHKDANHKDYHEFVESSASKPKSARASSLASAIKGTAGARAASNGGNDDIGPDDSCSECTYVFGHNVHHLPSTEGYHEFIGATPAPQVVAESGG